MCLEEIVMLIQKFFSSSFLLSWIFLLFYNAEMLLEIYSLKYDTFVFLSWHSLSLYMDWKFHEDEKI